MAHSHTATLVRDLITVMDDAVAQATALSRVIEGAVHDLQPLLAELSANELQELSARLTQLTTTVTRR